MLHVKRLAVLCASAILGCTPARSTCSAPTPPLVLDVHLPTEVNSPSLERAPVPASEEETAPDWFFAYSNVPLSETERSTWLAASQVPSSTRASHAAFVLGRRTPTNRLPSTLSQLPPLVRQAFVRGAAGRNSELQRASFPSTLIDPSSPTPIDNDLASWISRARAERTGIPESTLHRLLASNRLDEQIVAARLLSAGDVSPSLELIDYLSPLAASLAFRALAARGNVPSVFWLRWISSMALRTHANPRVWGNTWLSLLENVPKHLPDLRTPLLQALASLATIELDAPRSTFEFRCTLATQHDLLFGALNLIDRCAPPPFHWRTLSALARYARDASNARDRLHALHKAHQEANGDPRVLEALADAVVQFPPSVARPMLIELASNRDPGVLASLLEALTLHVQHARSLPIVVLDRLLRTPFDLEEAPSLEARLHAIQLARTLARPLPTGPTTVRALQQALHPDVQVPSRVDEARPMAETGDLILTLRNGRIVIRIDARSAPQASRVVIEAARSGRYNGTIFHRVVPSFVAQGGDPRGDGYGGTSRIVPTELSGERFERGAVGIALAGLDTGGMQFFIVTVDAPHLDARYPWIGRVVEGMECVDQLMVGDEMQRVEFVAHKARGSL